MCHENAIWRFMGGSGAQVVAETDLKKFILGLCFNVFNSELFIIDTKFI